MFGDDVPLLAQVVVLNGYSAHGDRTQLHTWLNAVRDGGAGHDRTRPRVHLVHGEPQAQDAFAAALMTDGYSVDAPTPGTQRPL